MFLVSAAVALTPNALAQSLQVNGQAGVLGEKTEFFGPLTLKHTGLCTKDGPEEKSGELRIQPSRSSSRIEAILLVDGVACSFAAKKSHAFDGVMKCPNRDDVPLLIWVR